MQTWDDRQPIYRQLADQLAGALLDGQPPEGEPMPSVRALAAQYLLNPITVGRALQALATTACWTTAAASACTFVPGPGPAAQAGAPALPGADEWPQLRTRLRRLGLQARRTPLGSLNGADA
jgi:GntR family transcriptional regulator